MSLTIHKIKLDDSGSGYILHAHQQGLLSGDGAPERVKLCDAVIDKLKAHGELVKALPKDAERSVFSCELDVSSGTLKAWLAGASNAIMRGGRDFNDTHVSLLFAAAKALGVLGELKRRIPAFNADEKVLELDSEPELVRDDEDSSGK